MAKSGERQLKVFQARLGFFETVVAAPSQAAALRAWEVHQNLFADGQARATDDPQVTEAALAHPGVPLKRALGSNDPFALEAVSLPQVPDAPRKTKVKAAVPRKPPADRSDLDAAEKALRSLDHDRRAEEASFRQRQEALDADRKASQAAYVERHDAVSQALAQARAAYRKAGGTAGT